MGEQRAKFRVPLTHAIAPYLFPQLVDAIEGAHAVLLDARRAARVAARAGSPRRSTRSTHFL